MFELGHSLQRAEVSWQYITSSFAEVIYQSNLSASALTARGYEGANTQQSIMGLSYEAEKSAVSRAKQIPV